MFGTKKYDEFGEENTIAVHTFKIFLTRAGSFVQWAAESKKTSISWFPSEDAVKRPLGSYTESVGGEGGGGNCIYILFGGSVGRVYPCVRTYWHLATTQSLGPRNQI